MLFSPYKPRQWPSIPLACLLEDIPENYLTGQSCPLATPLLIPLACLLEDIPQSYLTGQFYPLATPLLTPLACLLEDIPQSRLNGQYYSLVTPFACIWQVGWLAFYRKNLAQPGVNYWEWKYQLLSDQVNPELSLLLTLPEPQPIIKGVLESLAQDNPIVWTWANLCAFQKWHQQATQKLGLASMKAIYLICYRTPWDRLQWLFTENSPPINQDFFDVSSPWWKVLGITAFSSPFKVEQAYKNLLRLWHPDLTLHPLAHQITARLNGAYEQYIIRSQRQAERINSIQQWFKSK
ncbi:chaperon protein DnaJ [Aphanothece sacrum FPU1]|uniref:Chaperon protein DnaJ n=1 Tax=Aphanothece sacrum FPU1 TaxID=1920663 RepID=A0A401IMT6_APHSA|nr:chaperon protein DnaJ [Aphanothece sacrum FPU1]GBF84689.1 heat-shock protein DnaJ [Aphanothece sacrum FPU3]